MIDLKEEQKYEHFRGLMQELHLPAYNASWTLEVRDKEGRLIQRHRQRSHSWTRNAYNHLFSNMCAKNATSDSFGAGFLSAKSTAGTVYGNTGLGSVLSYAGAPSYGDIEGTSYGVKAGAGIAGWGIIVGSGTDAESFEDYALQAAIAHGEGSGQLTYIAQEAHSVSYNAETKVLQDELMRYFNNNSGADIDVNEVGMVYRFYKAFGTVTNIRLARDKLSAAVSIPDTGQLKVIYSLELTYPA